MNTQITSFTNEQGQSFPVIVLPKDEKYSEKIGQRKARILVAHAETVAQFANGEDITLSETVIVGTYKGNVTLKIITAEHGPFTFGKAKAKLFTQYMDDIRAFAAQEVNSEAG